jgi:phosphoglycolate phosphatase-like HAD superfamily hydrolase
MLHFGVDASSCVMMGDAQADIDAAQDNNIDFIFRRHQDNLQLNIDNNIQTIENFNEL